jgi:hypothetical protein
MQFPVELTFADKLAMLANTFRHRIGPMVLLAALFLSRDTPRLQAFGSAILGWIVFEALVKLRIDANKR